MALLVVKLSVDSPRDQCLSAIHHSASLRPPDKRFDPLVVDALGNSKTCDGERNSEGQDRWSGLEEGPRLAFSRRGCTRLCDDIGLMVPRHTFVGQARSTTSISMIAEMVVERFQVDVYDPPRYFSQQLGVGAARSSARGLAAYV